MKNKKIVVSIVLAIFFAISQVVLASGSDMQGAYYGDYTSNVPGFSGNLEFCIESDGSLIGEITLRGSECDLDLDFVMERANMEIFRGTLTRKADGFTTDVVLTISPHPDLDVVGRIILLNCGVVLGYSAQEVQ